MQRLAQQRVTESEARLIARDQHLFGDRSRSASWTLGSGRHGGELASSSARPTDDRRPLGVGRQLLDPSDERVAQALGRRTAAVEARRQQLFGVQRIALAAIEQPSAARRPAPTEDVGQALRSARHDRRAAGRSAARDPPLELRQQRSQRMSAMQLVAAVGEQHQYRV